MAFKRRHLKPQAIKMLLAVACYTNHVYRGRRRVSIFGLEKAQTNNFTISIIITLFFNGEIYNFIE
jgi:asparagine synthetase B (glutamine-hydrolysing)